MLLTTLFKVQMVIVFNFTVSLIKPYTVIDSKRAQRNLITSQMKSQLDKTHVKIHPGAVIKAGRKAPSPSQPIFPSTFKAYWPNPMTDVITEDQSKIELDMLPFKSKSYLVEFSRYLLQKI